ERLVARGALGTADRIALGFTAGVTLEGRLRVFSSVLEEVKRASPDLAKLTELEADTYRDGHFSTYFAGRGLMTVFIDGTERSPTFRLALLDTTEQPQRRSWFQVWTPGKDGREAWHGLLGRTFRGLNAELYETPFSTRIDDAYLRSAALTSLKNAGDEQQDLYDFSFSDASIRRTGPTAGDLGVIIAIDDESTSLAPDGQSEFDTFAKLFEGAGAKLGLIVVGTGADLTWRGAASSAPIVQVRVGNADDPFRVDQNIALKILLNAHSTAVMTRLGKVVGNTMTNVSPSNLKLIGRATHLIKLHVDDVLRSEHWIARHGEHNPIAYSDSNAVLFDVISYVHDKRASGDQSASEVALSIVRILESLRSKRRISLDEAFGVLNTRGLNGYLAMVRL
ncbi:MAG TPA: hypothetical protein VK636_20235, partial [Gemmatimonadaceae bacterium]|nr:hypothetical protein [Gemmatimonadaceae bacterium]